MSCLEERTSNTDAETTSIHFVNAGFVASIDEERFAKRVASLRSMREEHERTNSEQDSEGTSPQNGQDISPEESEFFSADPEHEAEESTETEWFSLRR